jgi:hypothetical protein
MNEIALHKKAMRLVTPGEIERIRKSTSPYEAADIVREYQPRIACAMIALSDPLTAAFIIEELHQRAKFACQRSMMILTHAHRLQIRGTKGLWHARGEFLEKLGSLLCPEPNTRPFPR